MPHSLHSGNQPDRFRRRYVQGDEPRLVEGVFRPLGSPIEALGLGQMRIKGHRFLLRLGVAEPLLRWHGFADPRADRPAHSPPAKAPPRHRPPWLRGLERNSLPREAPKPHWPTSATAGPFARAIPEPAPTRQIARPGRAPTLIQGTKVRTK